MQRLIFYSNSPWEAWEQEHLDKFAAYLEHQGLAVPPEFRQEEVLRHLQAAQFNHKKAYENMERQIEWRKANLPVKVTDQVETLIVMNQVTYLFRNLDSSTFMEEIAISVR